MGRVIFILFSTCDAIKHNFRIFAARFEQHAMKPIRTLIFILSVIVILGAGWYFFPAEGLAIGGLNLRFPSYADDSHPKQAEVDVDDVLWGRAGQSGITLLGAEGGIEGMPSLVERPSRYQRRLEKSADGKSLVFYASSGCVIIFR